ncbi:SH3 domain-containing protein [Jannaschia rubra]|uniref:SH3 domain-containing protein n=1 Tax=Jannaschia rubra TaxID=282197 RepID=UPI002493BB66|nr:SH3 domain-containing protein [Jannaschia rubra]
MRLVPLILVLLLSPVGALAQTLYVKQTEEGYLNLRSGPGTVHDVLLRLSPGDRVDIEETLGIWAHVRLPSGQRGWVSSSYLERGAAEVPAIRFVAPTTVGYLNLRAGPGTGHAVLRRMYPGDRLAPLERRGDWLRVRHVSGAVGWAHGDYITG